MIITFVSRCTSVRREAVSHGAGAGARAAGAGRRGRRASCARPAAPARALPYDQVNMWWLLLFLLHLPRKRGCIYVI